MLYRVPFALGRRPQIEDLVIKLLEQKFKYQYINKIWKETISSDLSFALINPFLLPPCSGVQSSPSLHKFSTNYKLLYSIGGKDF